MTNQTIRIAGFVFSAVVAIAGVSMAGPPAAPQTQAKLPEVIGQIMKADYEGDRAALDRLYHTVDAYLGDKTIEARVRYWKGYTKWRRAINGANEKVDPAELAADLELGVQEMQRSSSLDPAFIDAKVGEMQCLGLILFFDRQRAGNDERIARLRALVKELQASATDNPRYTWAWGMAFYGVPADKGGGPDNVIRAYLKALDGIKQGAGKPKTRLDPAWGEPELYVNLAYTYLHKPEPDLALAHKYVDEALKRVPHWHYAKDLLRPQIEAAQKKQPGDSGAK